MAAPGPGPSVPRPRPRRWRGPQTMANSALHPHIIAMMHEGLSETVSERNQRREAEITEALQREAERHQAAVKNMHRLRALRLKRDQKAKGP